MHDLGSSLICKRSCKRINDNDARQTEDESVSGVRMRQFGPEERRKEGTEEVTRARASRRRSCVVECADDSGGCGRINPYCTSFAPLNCCHLRSAVHLDLGFAGCSHAIVQLSRQSRHNATFIYEPRVMNNFTNLRRMPPCLSIDKWP